MPKEYAEVTNAAIAKQKELIYSMKNEIAAMKIHIAKLEKAPSFAEYVDVQESIARDKYILTLLEKKLKDVSRDLRPYLKRLEDNYRLRNL